MISFNFPTLYPDFLILFIYMFTIGLLGLLFWGRHLILILICFELILLSIASLFVLFSISTNDILGQIIPLILLCLAGADSAFGLALFLLIFRQYGSITVNHLDQLRH